MGSLEGEKGQRYSGWRFQQRRRRNFVVPQPRQLSQQLPGELRRASCACARTRPASDGGAVARLLHAMIVAWQILRHPHLRRSPRRPDCLLQGHQWSRNQNASFFSGGTLLGHAGALSLSVYILQLAAFRPPGAVWHQRRQIINRCGSQCCSRTPAPAGAGSVSGAWGAQRLLVRP